MTAKIPTMLALATILLLSTFTVPSIGMVGFAAAKSDDRGDEDKEEFSRLIRGDDDDRKEDRKPKVDKEDAKNLKKAGPKEKRNLNDLDIKSYGFDGTDAFIEVYGTAGGTTNFIPEEHHDVIAYVIDIVTEDGDKETWAVDSHEAEHGESGPGEEWHAHKVHLTDDPATHKKDATCLNEVDHVTHAMMDGHKVIFEGMKSEDIDADRITSAATVLLELQVEDPDDPPEGTPCIAKVVHVFDTADLDKRERNG
jgi:hypothetical protein